MLSLRLGTARARSVRCLSSSASNSKTKPKYPPFLTGEQKKRITQERQAEERIQAEVDRLTAEKNKKGPVESASEAERDPAPHVGRRADPLIKARSREELQELLRKAGMTPNAARDKYFDTGVKGDEKLAGEGATGEVDVDAKVGQPHAEAKADAGVNVPTRGGSKDSAASSKAGQSSRAAQKAERKAEVSNGTSGSAAVSDKEIQEALSAADADAPAGEAAEAEDHLEHFDSVYLTAKDVPIFPVAPPRDAPIARLGRQLQKVLFSPGVHMLRDPRTGTWNFHDSLHAIPKPEEFAFNRLPQYITASKDEELASMSEGEGLKYVGSTSTLTQSMSQIYFAMNGGRGVNLATLSQSGGFGTDRWNSFTYGAQLPAILTLKLLPNGRYAIDNDKRYDVELNVLSDYGRILEKLLTSEPDDFARFLKTAPESAVPEEERTAREAYCYSRSSSLLMRSQLDCQDKRLPGMGTFDIKTRACYPIRHDRANHIANSAYDISTMFGQSGSYEREYYDLTRSGMLKYCLQARIGQMDGIFVAYHNTTRCFGFQYLPLSELDERLFGSTDVAEQVFSVCVGVLERILKEVTTMMPGQDISLTINHKRKPTDRWGREIGDAVNELEVTAQPAHNNGGADAMPARAMRFKFTNRLNGEVVGVDMPEFSEQPELRRQQLWGVDYELAITPEDAEGFALARKWREKHVKLVADMNRLSVPEGMTPGEMAELDRARLSTQSEETLENNEGTSVSGDVASTETTRRPARILWVQPNERVEALRQMAKESGEAYRKRVAAWSQEPGMWWHSEHDAPPRPPPSVDTAPPSPPPGGSSPPGPQQGLPSLPRPPKARSVGQPRPLDGAKTAKPNKQKGAPRPPDNVKAGKSDKEKGASRPPDGVKAAKWTKGASRPAAVKAAKSTKQKPAKPAKLSKSARVQGVKMTPEQQKMVLARAKEIAAGQKGASVKTMDMGNLGGVPHKQRTPPHVVSI